MTLYEEVPEENVRVPLAVGQVRLTKLDVECHILRLDGKMVSIFSPNSQPPNGNWQSSITFIQRTTKFLRKL